MSVAASCEKSDRPETHVANSKGSDIVDELNFRRQRAPVCQDKTLGLTFQACFSSLTTSTLNYS